MEIVIEVTQTWVESEYSKTGWQLLKPWSNEYGLHFDSEDVIITDYDNFGNAIKGIVYETYV